MKQAKIRNQVLALKQLSLSIDSNCQSQLNIQINLLQKNIHENTRMCKYWRESGMCPYGDRCYFRHETIQLPRKCKFGSSCKYYKYNKCDYMHYNNNNNNFKQKPYGINNPISKQYFNMHPTKNQAVKKEPDSLDDIKTPLLEDMDESIISSDLKIFKDIEQTKHLNNDYFNTIIVNNSNEPEKEEVEDDEEEDDDDDDDDDGPVPFLDNNASSVVSLHSDENSGLNNETTESTDDDDYISFADYGLGILMDHALRGMNENDFALSCLFAIAIPIGHTFPELNPFIISSNMSIGEVFLFAHIYDLCSTHEMKEQWKKRFQVIKHTAIWTNEEINNAKNKMNTRKKVKAFYQLFLN